MSGREFTAADTLTAPKVAIVNEVFAKKFGLGRDAVGKLIGSGSGNRSKLDTLIVGVAQNAKLQRGEARHSAAVLPALPAGRRQGYEPPACGGRSPSACRAGARLQLRPLRRALSRADAWRHPPAHERHRARRARGRHRLVGRRALQPARRDWRKLLELQDASELARKRAGLPRRPGRGGLPRCSSDWDGAPDAATCRQRGLGAHQARALLRHDHPERASAASASRRRALGVSCAALDAQRRLAAVTVMVPELARPGRAAAALRHRRAEAATTCRASRAARRCPASR